MSDDANRLLAEMKKAYEPDVDIEPGILIDETYRLISRIGTGSVGDVWRARDFKHGRFVALKITRPTYVSERNWDQWSKARDREAKALELSACPNVPAFYEVGRDTHWNAKTLIYYAMELVEGQPVNKRIAAGGYRGLPLSEAIHVLLSIAKALEVIHAAGVVHRDVKPSNMLWAEDGRVLLIDFGLVRLPDGSGPSSFPVGTPRYIAPEAARELVGAPLKKELYPLVDLYSLAASGYEVLTGQALFTGEMADEVIERHLFERPRAPSWKRDDLPPGLDTALLRALEKRPEDRYPSVKAFREVLESLFPGVPTSPNEPMGGARK